MFDAVATEVRHRQISLVVVAARGTSDNAGLYAKYLWGAYNGLPIALAAPSLFTSYARPPRLRNGLVLGISQSGQSPDIVGVLEEARRQGAPTLALVNDPSSPLAKAADHVIDLCAGPEKAVAATNELQRAARRDRDAVGGRWERTKRARASSSACRRPWAGRSPSEGDDRRARPSARVMGRLRRARAAASTTRRTFEWALKLKELAYADRRARTRSADFQHGPVALLERGFPVLAAAPAGAVFPDAARAAAAPGGREAGRAARDLRPGGRRSRSRTRPLAAGRAGAARVAGRRSSGDRAGPAPPRSAGTGDRPGGSTGGTPGSTKVAERGDLPQPAPCLGQACLPLDQAPSSRTTPSAITAPGQIVHPGRAG